SSGPKDRTLLWAIQRKRLKAQGTGHKAKTIKKQTLSLYLAPYTLHPKPLLLARPLNSGLALNTRFSILNE
ncbi:MAG: hypothetical protein PVF48_15885, partial [Syntrophobacterales bacterium]